MYNKLVVLIVLVIYANSSCEQDLSPFSFGLKNAVSDVDRYNVLYKTHVSAIKKGVNVDYTGVESIAIEIPDNASPIPLTKKNDFKGLTLFVNNHYRRQAIFQMVSDFSPIVVSNTEIERGVFDNDALNNGLYLLSIEDKNPWVEQRIGYDYGHQRKDILLVRNGRSVNSTIASYSTKQSRPIAEYIKTSSLKKSIKNISIVRSPQASRVSICFHIYGQNNVSIENVKIKTPESDLTMDAAIAIEKSTNIKVDNVVIDGTYSKVDKYGYGFLLDNVWNSQFSKINAKAKWGIFGNKNINTAKISKSRLNRFDVHCYGRDFSIMDCEFYDLYNQFSSIFGFVNFVRCTFKNFTPVLMEYTYNAYTPFQLSFRDCVFYTNKRQCFVINVGLWGDAINSRQELKGRYWPDVSIKNFTVIPTEQMSDVYLFYLRSGSLKKITLEGGLNIVVDGLTLKKRKNDMHFRVSNNNIKSRMEINIKQDKVKGGKIDRSSIQ